jgi:hypothetical protein
MILFARPQRHARHRVQGITDVSPVFSIPANGDDQKRIGKRNNHVRHHLQCEGTISKESSTMDNQRETAVTTLRNLLICLCLLLAGCANSEKIDNRNYAFDSYYPTPNEIQLGQKRAQRYWAKNSQRWKNPTRYLAVYVTSIDQGDVNQNLYSKLINSQTTTNFFETYSSLNASCIMIYDTATNGFVSNQGYASVDLPSRGAIARWDGYTAKYIGW